MPYTASLDPDEMNDLGARLESLSEQLVGLSSPRGGSVDSLGTFDLVFAVMKVRRDAKNRAKEVADWIMQASRAVHETTEGFEAADDASRQEFEKSAADIYGKADRED